MKNLQIFRTKAKSKKRKFLRELILSGCTKCKKVHFLYFLIRDYFLNNKQVHDKFIFVNRVNNLPNLLDMSLLKDSYFRIFDLIPSQYQHFILEAYRMPSNFNELQSRIFKENKSIKKNSLAVKNIQIIKNSSRSIISNNSSSLQLDESLKQNESDFVWILKKQEQDVKKIMIVNPDSASDISRIQEFLPCIVQRRISRPLTLNKNNVNQSFKFKILLQCIVSVFVLISDFLNLKLHIFNQVKVKFYQGNYQIGYQTKYRFQYDKLQDILQQRGLIQASNNSIENDLFWNKLCQRVILICLMLQLKAEFIPERTVQLLEMKFQIDENGNPWLQEMKADLSFRIKENIFDDLNAHLFDEIIKILEQKIKKHKIQELKTQFLISGQLTQSTNNSLEKPKKATKEQILNTKLYQKKNINVNDAVKIAQIDGIPSSYYMYKYKNDYLLNRVRSIDREQQLIQDRVNDRCVSQMNEGQKDKIRKVIEKNKNQLQFKAYNTFKEQLIEDVERILNCEDSEQMNEDLYLIRKVDAQFVKESLLEIYQRAKGDVNNFIKNYKVLIVIADEKEWIEHYLIGIQTNKRNAKVFLGLIKDKLKNCEKEGILHSNKYKDQEHQLKSQRIKQLMQSKLDEGYYFRKFSILNVGKQNKQQNLTDRSSLQQDSSHTGYMSQRNQDEQKNQEKLKSLINLFFKFQLKIDPSFNQNQYLSDTPPESSFDSSEQSKSNFQIIPRDEDYLAKKQRLQKKNKQFEKKFKCEKERLVSLERLVSTPGFNEKYHVQKNNTSSPKLENQFQITEQSEGSISFEEDMQQNFGQLNLKTTSKVKQNEEDQYESISPQILKSKYHSVINQLKTIEKQKHKKQMTPSFIRLTEQNSPHTSIIRNEKSGSKSPEQIRMINYQVKSGSVTSRNIQNTRAVTSNQHLQQRLLVNSDINSPKKFLQKRQSVQQFKRNAPIKVIDQPVSLSNTNFKQIQSSQSQFIKKQDVNNYQWRTQAQTTPKSLIQKTPLPQIKHIEPSND
eukprot:403342780